MSYNLHEHQADALQAIYNSFRSGKRRPMVMAPTGFGKTVLAAEIISRAVAKGNRVIFTVPSISLVDQTYEKFTYAGIPHIGIMQAKHPKTDARAPVQIACLATLRRRQLPKAQLVLIDEAHQNSNFLWKWMSDPEWSTVPFIGLSATPWAKGLGKHYSNLIVAATTGSLIEKGYLSSFVAFGPPSGIKPELDGIRTLAGDYHEGMLSAEMQKPKLVADAVQTWLEKGEDRPTLVFAVDRAHARKLQDEFKRSGIVTEYIDAHTKREDRELIGMRFKHGLTRIVVNVGCLTTGVDWDVRCIVLCRPTKSEILYTQIIGRGLRTASGKDHCLILDHSDTTRRLGFVDDISHDSLDDGTSPRNKRQAPKRDKPLPRECLQCGRLIPENIYKCPHCGYLPQRPCKVNQADGELIQLSRKKMQYTTEVKQAWYGQLLCICDERGWKPGRAYHLYKEKFGVGPGNSIRKIRYTPTAEVLQFVQSRNIAYAKAQERRIAA